MADKRKVWCVSVECFEYGCKATATGFEKYADQGHAVPKCDKHKRPDLRIKEPLTVKTCKGAL